MLEVVLVVNSTLHLGVIDGVIVGRCGCFMSEFGTVGRRLLVALELVRLEMCRVFMRLSLRRWERMGAAEREPGRQRKVGAFWQLPCTGPVEAFAPGAGYPSCNLDIGDFDVACRRAGSWKTRLGVELGVPVAIGAVATWDASSNEADRKRALGASLAEARVAEIDEETHGQPGSLSCDDGRNCHGRRR